MGDEQVSGHEPSSSIKGRGTQSREMVLFVTTGRSPDQKLSAVTCGLKKVAGRFRSADIIIAANDGQGGELGRINCGYSYGWSRGAVNILLRRRGALSSGQD